MFLSCVRLTGQVFGPGHIIAVLRGSQSERVLARRHDQLTTYGAGKEHSTEEWRELSNRFIHIGLIAQDLQFGGLQLTVKGWDVIQGKEKVAVSVEQRSLLPTAEGTSSGLREPELLARLRIIRKELADQSNVPAFVIFSDRTLREMAASLPQSEQELLAVNGVGEVKLAKYGAILLEAIRSYSKSRGMAIGATAPATSSKPIIRPVTRRRFHEVGKLFAAGQDVDDIARRYEVTRATVVQNLQRFFKSGGQLEPERVLAASRLSEPDRASVLGAFDRLGLERLAPVHNALSAPIAYEELHLLRLYLLCRDGVKEVGSELQKKS
jgi:ATP-dependent DNA helicase RecQ